MQNGELQITDGARAGAWIKPRLGRVIGSVSGLVPEGFGAYARIFHPASDPEGSPVSWATVARMCGTTSHREMQWQAIVGLADTDEIEDHPGDARRLKWAGSDPLIGEMDIETLDALCKILNVHTADPAHCFFGLCTIQDWEEFFTQEELENPLLQLPYDRDYIVIEGPLSAVVSITFDWPKQRRAPNLIWPAERSWLVATGVDFDSTLVGGTVDLIRAIVESPQLEAWQVRTLDSLTVDADKINAIQGRQ